ncbi:MAG: hypothetical protein A4S09_12820 [Proteobacteria bacterium SG_bin7]|nr:MAG: hypothetical protein A4S09_12820 [Proteobacteria bacterium SG_bin7]
MKVIITILGTLLITLTSLAAADSKSCIEALNGKSVSFEFGGNVLSGPDIISLKFDSSTRGGRVTYSNDDGLNAVLEIYPVAKMLVRELSLVRADQEIGERNVRFLDCYAEKQKKSCESSVKVFFSDLIKAQSTALTHSDEIDQAIACTLESLQKIVF